MPEEIVVLGAGGHATVVVSTALDAGFDIVAAYDDDPATHGLDVLGVPVVGVIGAAHGAARAVVAIGDNPARTAVLSRIDIPWATIVHPTAIVASGVEIGVGSVVFAGGVLQAGTVIGDHTIVNTCATIDHHCSIGRVVHVGPGVTVCGNVTIGDGALIGAGATLAPGVRVGSDAVVGAGSVVIDDVGAGEVVAGVPARRIDRP